MKIRDFEAMVWEVENIRIVIRAPENATVSEFEKKNSADKNLTVNDWLNRRIVPLLEGHEVFVTHGSGEKLNKGTQIKNVRDSYTE